MEKLVNLRNIVIVIFCSALTCFFKLSILPNLSKFTIKLMTFCNFLKHQNLSKFSHRPTCFVIPIFFVIPTTLCIIIGVCL